MVRRDDDGSPAGDPGENPSSRCGDPAGESPVSVSGNAPSSRLPARGEIPASEAERREPGNRREPLTGRQARGPQLEVKTAASSHLQSESVGCEPTGRAAHFTAKATSTMRDHERVGGLGGVRVAARVQGSPWNTREPSAQPPSRPGGSYKSKTKSNTAQRKSEGTIVPPAPATKAVQHNAAGGKGPWGLSRVDRRGTRKGMDAERPNSPRRRSPEDNVRRLQGRLRDVAKQQPGRKFHALYDRIYRSDVLYEAWNQVRRNQGAAGVDAQTIAAIEQNGVESFLEAIQAELRENEYQPQAVLRRYIPKADGKQQRPLGIPTVRDRVVQAATKLILEPIFGAARNSDNQAGESPVAAVVRLGCVALPDAHGGRPSRVQAQVNVLGAERSDLTGGLAKPGAAVVTNATASKGSSHENQVVGSTSEPSPAKMGEGQRCRPSSGQKRSELAPAYRRWHQGNGCRLKAGKVSSLQSPRHKSGTTRSSVVARLADRVVVAMMPRDNTTLAEQRTRGVVACEQKRGSPRHGLARPGPTGSSGRVAERALSARQTRREEGRAAKPDPSHYLEAVLGKTRRTEF
jgi:hypothetical protein